MHITLLEAVNLTGSLASMAGLAIAIKVLRGERKIEHDVEEIQHYEQDRSEHERRANKIEVPTLPARNHIASVGFRSLERGADWDLREVRPEASIVSWQSDKDQVPTRGPKNFFAET